MGALIGEEYRFDWLVNNGDDDRDKLEVVLLEHFDRTKEIYEQLEEDQKQRFRAAIGLRARDADNFTEAELEGALSSLHDESLQGAT